MGDDTHEIVLSGPDAVLVVSKYIGRIAEADKTVGIVAGAGYAQSFGFRGRDPPLAVGRACRRQSRRGRRIPVGIEVGGERALELRVGNLIEIGDAFAERPRSQRLTHD